MKKGLFIVFEGNEGSGKSIQVEILASHLKEKEEGHDIVVTREPGGTRVGELIRNITHDPENVDLQPKTEAYLMAAARAQHVSEIIEPALLEGKIVICDRYLDSSLAYQGYGRKLGEEVVANLNKLAVNGVRPDLTILLDIDSETGLKRRKGSKKKIDRLDLQQKDFYNRVTEGFHKIARNNPSKYFIISSKKSIEEIATTIWGKVGKMLKIIKK